LNKERIRLAIEALRSGEYTQGHYYTHYEIDGIHKFCATGVLQDVHLKAIGQSWKPMGKTDFGAQKFVYPVAYTVEWYGQDYKMFTHLYGLNDGGKKTFKQIADFLEKLIA
jgi:hypothetical protein